jgi:hypothetical protein
VGSRLQCSSGHLHGRLCGELPSRAHLINRMAVRNSAVAPPPPFSFEREYDLKLNVHLFF